MNQGEAGERPEVDPVVFLEMLEASNLRLWREQPNLFRAGMSVLLDCQRVQIAVYHSDYRLLYILLLSRPPYRRSQAHIQSLFSAKQQRACLDERPVPLLLHQIPVLRQSSPIYHPRIVLCSVGKEEKVGLRLGRVCSSWRGAAQS